MKLSRICFVLLTTVTMYTASYAALPYSLNSLSAKNETGNYSHQSMKEKMMVARMQEFIRLTPEEYGAARGKQLNFLDRISFRLSQHRMKHLLKNYDYGDGPDTLQKISWLIKGLILGPIALILGYLLLKDDDRELIKWIWFGFAGFTAIVITALLLM